MSRVAVLTALAVALWATDGCSECAGTPSCNGPPEASYSGQFIEHKSGRPVAGVKVTFIRTGGAELVESPMRAVSDADGNFLLRSPALQGGAVEGDMLVEPPPPWPPYTAQGLVLWLNTRRGGGGNFGRLVVDPYLLLVGFVYDRQTRAPIPGAKVTFNRVGGGRLETDYREFTTDFGGQFSWEPGVTDPDTIHTIFVIEAPGFSRPFQVNRDLVLQHEDGHFHFAMLPVGWGLAYKGVVLRRGLERALRDSSVTLQFTRLSGIAVDPNDTKLALNKDGEFNVTVRPLAEGSLTAEFRVVPRSPFHVETYVVPMQTSDDDVPVSIGKLHYGTQAYLVAQLRFGDNGEPVPAKTEAVFTRSGGVALDWPADSVDDGHRTVGAQGQVTYQAPTADSGSVQFDIIVQLPAPLAWDTLRNVTVPSRANDASTNLGTLLVRRRTQ